MDMFKEYGITKEEVNNMLNELRIKYKSIDKILDQLNDRIESIECYALGYEVNYSVDDIYNMIVTLTAIKENGYTLKDFAK